MTNRINSDDWLKQIKEADIPALSGQPDMGAGGPPMTQPGGPGDPPRFYDPTADPGGPYTGFPDQEIIQDLKIYAGLSSFEDSLENIAKESLEDGLLRIQAQSKVLQNIMLVLMASVIGWLGYGLFQLQQQVTTTAGPGF